MKSKIYEKFKNISQTEISAIFKDFIESEEKRKEYYIKGAEVNMYFIENNNKVYLRIDINV